ncbi:MAG TPA: condensation domain-containing protein, partial [Thermoanaerobaculia bacterium]|nr:condensation domain-containing protein [Thermoanaerobaculia bacterium]
MSAAADLVQGFALSPQQRRLWLLEAERRGALRAEIAAILEAPAGLAGVESALEAALRRHEVLRTRFRRVPGMSLPVQAIGDEPQLRVETRPAAPEDPAAAAAAVLAELAAAPVDPAEGPLGHVALAPAGPDRVLLCASLSSLVADGPSLSVLVREVAGGAGGRAAGGEPIQYADAAQAFNDLLESEEAREGKSFWQERDDPASWPRLRLPLGPGGAPAEGAGGAALEGAAGAELVARARGAAERLGVPARAFWLACWAVVLARASGSREVVLAARLDGRSYEGLDAAVGPFARTVPIPCEVRDEEPVAALAARMAEALT